MPYQLVTAIGKLANFDNRFIEVDITTQQLKDLYVNYTDVVTTLTHTTLAGTFYLDLSLLPSLVRYSTQTLPAYLNSIADSSLPVTTTAPNPRYNYVRFYDLWQYDFKVNGHNRFYHPEIELDVSQHHDLLVTKANANYGAMQKYAVATVNGFLHRVAAGPYGLVILDGGRSVNLCKDNLVGLMDFQHVGEISVVPDLEFVSWISGMSLREGVYLRVPAEHVGKTPLLSVGGYLHGLGPELRYVSDNVLKFDFANYPWLKKYAESKRYLDLSSLGDLELNPEQIDQTALYSDETITALFNLPQSFLIFVDTPTLTSHYEYLAKTGLPGRYQSGVFPKAPLVVGNGRLAEYRVMHEHGQYSIAVQNYLTPTYIADTYESQLPPVVTTGAIPHRPAEYSEAKLWYLSTTTI